MHTMAARLANLQHLPWAWLLAIKLRPWPPWCTTRQCGTVRQASKLRRFTGLTGKLSQLPDRIAPARLACNTVQHCHRGSTVK